MRNILIIEDDLNIAELERDYLKLNGFGVSIETNGAAGLKKALTGEFDVIIADLMLPDKSGFDIIREVRKKLEIPVIVVSAKDEDIDKIRGLDFGADDYLTKPFAFAELVARVQALGRRSTPALPPVLERHGVVLDVARHTATRDGRALGLSPKEFGVLHVLMRAGGRVVSAEELLEQAWDEFADPFTNAVRVTVMTLRKKLGQPSVIHTVPKAGYRIGAPE